MYYNKQGQEISIGEFSRLIEQGLDYKRVDFDKLEGNIEVSTVWLGIDHAFRSDTPIIFETMVFRPTGEGGKSEGDECERYSTLDEAHDGHRRMVAIVEAQRLTPHLAMQVEFDDTGDN